MPPLDQEMFSGSVDTCFVLALPFQHGDLEPDCVSFDEGGLMLEGGGIFAGHYDTSFSPRPSIGYYSMTERSRSK